MPKFPGGKATFGGRISIVTSAREQGIYTPIENPSIVYSGATTVYDESVGFLQRSVASSCNPWPFFFSHGFHGLTRIQFSRLWELQSRTTCLRVKARIIPLKTHPLLAYPPTAR